MRPSRCWPKGRAGHPLKLRHRVAFLVQRARALVTLGRGRETCEVVRDALNCGLTDGSSLNILGTALSQAGRPEDAVPLLEIAVRADPKVADYWYNLGGVQQFLGDMDAAEFGYERAVAASDHFSAHLALARLKKWSADSHHIDRLKALKPATVIDTARLNYALFKEHDDLGDYDQAWGYLQSGAQAAKQVYPWQAADKAAIVNAWRTHIPHPPIAAPPSQHPRRIFIVGLPRSGTTLVERILTAHSDVQALGELQTFGLGVKHGSGSGGAIFWMRTPLPPPRTLIPKFLRNIMMRKPPICIMLRAILLISCRTIMTMSA